MECGRQQLARLVWLAVLPLFLAIALTVADVAPADAATIVVNSSGEDLDVGGSPSAPNGQCTLLEALNNANNNFLRHPDCVPDGAFAAIDRVELRIPPGFDPNFGCDATTRVCTIAISGTYLLTDPVTIDGYTQAQAVPNTLAVGSNALIKIRLLPKPGTFVTTAFRIQANDVTLRGLSIGGFEAHGVHVTSGSNARIVGCFIGVDPDGTTALRMIGTGIVIASPATNATIGGSSPADRNIISGQSSGLYLYGASFNTIKGNAIGTNAAGTAGIPSVAGVYLLGNGNVVGGTAPGDGNVIAYHTASGVVVGSGPNGPGTGNAIYANGGLGIDLDGDGVTPNDTGDPDLGPNRSQNSPSLTGVGVRVNTTVHGRLNSTPGRQFRIELFSNTACDAGGGEGETYLGSVDTATTDGNGNVSFVAVFPQPVPAGRLVTATATDLTTVDTSEFSGCRQAMQAGLAVSADNPERTTEANDGGSDDAFTISIATIPVADVTIPISVSDPTEGGVSLSPGGSTFASSTSLTFRPVDGVTSRTVFLRGVDDAIDDGDVPYTLVIGPATSADPNYNGLNPADVSVTNVDNDDSFLQCIPRPKVNVAVVKLGNGQLRATVSVTANNGTQNELQAITWTQLDTATVFLYGVGPVQQGQVMTFAPLTQSATFDIARTPGAQTGTVRLTLSDVCGAWPTLVGGGPRAW